MKNINIFLIGSYILCTSMLSYTADDTPTTNNAIIPPSLTKTVRSNDTITYTLIKPISTSDNLTVTVEATHDVGTGTYTASTSRSTQKPGEAKHTTKELFDPEYSKKTFETLEKNYNKQSTLQP